MLSFSIMIYVGDGLTDVLCMKLIKVNGGESIAVYNRVQGRQQAGVTIYIVPYFRFTIIWYFEV